MQPCGGAGASCVATVSVLCSLRDTLRITHGPLPHDVRAERDIAFTTCQKQSLAMDQSFLGSTTGARVCAEQRWCRECAGFGCDTSSG